MPDSPKLDTTVRQTALYFAAVVIGQGLSFLLLPVATRFLDAAAYGEYALATAVSSLVGMFSTAWIRNVGMRLYFDAVNRGTTKGFYLTMAGLQLGVFTFFYVITALAFSLMHVEFVDLRTMISAGVVILLADQYNLAVMLLRAEQATVPYAVAEITAGVLRFVATVAGLFAGLATAAMLFDGASVGFLVAGAIAVVRLWPRLVGPTKTDLLGLREVVGTGPKSVPYSVSAWLERLADRLVLQHYLGVATVGIYSVGYTIGERIIMSIAQAVFMMAWPRILNAWNSGGAEAARHAIASAQRLFAWLTIGPTFFLIIYGPPLTRWLAGAEYSDSAKVVPIIVAALWLGAFGTYVNRHLELNKRFGALSTVAVIGALLNLGLNFLLIPSYGMLGAASATLGNYAFNALAYFLIRDQVMSVLDFKPFVAATVLSLLVYGVCLLLPASDVLRMVVFVCAYGAATLAVLLRR